MYRKLFLPWSDHFQAKKFIYIRIGILAFTYLILMTAIFLTGRGMTDYLYSSSLMSKLTEKMGSSLLSWGHLNIRIQFVYVLFLAGVIGPLMLDLYQIFFGTFYGLNYRIRPATANLYRRLVKIREYRSLNIMSGLRYDLDKIVKTGYCFWQPQWWVALKGLALLIVLGMIYPLHYIVGGWFEEVMSFFRLQEIYSFEFPESSFFIGIAKGLFIALLGYFFLYGFYYLYQYFFSELVLIPEMNKIYYRHRKWFTSQLYVIETDDLKMVSIKQNWVQRLIMSGDIRLERVSGDTITVKGVGRAAMFLHHYDLMMDKKNDE